MQQLTSGVTLTPVRPAISLPAARWSLGAAALVLGLLAALHLLSPELDPSWRMVSEYALGDYGWVLALLFVSWALSSVTLFFAVKSQAQTIGGKIGLGFLLASALGMSMAAVFDVSHDLHGVAALIGMPSFPIAALLISFSLGRNPAWSPARRLLLWTAQLPWLSVVLMTVAVLTRLAQTGGEFGPGMWIGWANRLLVVAYCVWLIIVARLALRLGTQDR